MRYVEKLLDNQFTITLTDIHRPTDFEASFAPCDISKFDSVSMLFEKIKPEAIVHLAAITGVRKCQEKPFESFITNVVGTFNIAMLCSTYNTRLIFASSREVYGETIGDETAEEAELHPNNLYGLTKLLGESMIAWLGTSAGLRYTVLRFTNLYGSGGDQYAVAALIKRALEGEEIQILGGTQVLNLIHVEDAARAIETCLKRPELPNTVFNIGSKDTIRVDDLIKRIISLTNSRSGTRGAPMRTGDTIFFRPNLDKAHQELGFTAKIDFQRGLRECITHYCTK